MAKKCLWLLITIGFLYCIFCQIYLKSFARFDRHNKNDVPENINAEVPSSNYCNGPFIPAFKPTNFEIDAHPMRSIPKYKIGVCHTPKSGSMAVSKALSHVAYDNDTALGQHIRQTSKLKSANGFAYFSFIRRLPLPPSEAFIPGSDWTNFIVVRHPITRFLSAFSDICLHDKACSGFKSDDFPLFVETMYSALRNISEGLPIRNNFDFIAMYHFFPSTWFCSGFMTQQNFGRFQLLKQDSPSFLSDFDALLKGAGVESDKLNEFGTVMRYKSHSHSKDRSALEKYMKREAVRTCLEKITRRNADLLHYELFPKL